VQVPPTGRFGNLRTPAKGTLVSVRGILSGITEYETALIDMEAVTFISLSNNNRSNVPAPTASSSSLASTSALPGASSVGRTKRQRRMEQEASPSKKIRVGPPEMFLSGAALEDFTGEAPTEKAPEASPLQTRSKSKAA
jgi:hypothetical protein